VARARRRSEKHVCRCPQISGGACACKFGEARQFEHLFNVARRLSALVISAAFQTQRRIFPRSIGWGNRAEIEHHVHCPLFGGRPAQNILPASSISLRLGFRTLQAYAFIVVFTTAGWTKKRNKTRFAVNTKRKVIDFRDKNHHNVIGHIIKSDKRLFSVRGIPGEKTGWLTLVYPLHSDLPLWRKGGWIRSKP